MTRRLALWEVRRHAASPRKEVVTMSIDTPQPGQRPNKRVGVTIALVSAGVIAGAIGATALGANAGTPSGSSSTSNGSTSSSAATAPQGSAATSRPDPGGTDPMRSDEKSVTSAQESTLKTAAVKAVPGGTVIRVETDAGDATYEVHMQKADGSLVTVKFDKNLKVAAVEPGMGMGDPAPAGGPGHRDGHGPTNH
jgi:hypothetical protein